MGKVPIQKGAINANQKTMKTMTHSEKVNERAGQLKTLKSGQSLTLHTPKTGKR
jgi:hypothetical protein